MLSMMTMQPKPLATLSAVDVVPQRFTERTRVLSFLKRIDTVHIHEHEEHDGVAYYKMDVIFEHRITRIPTNRGKVLSRRYHGKADRVVLRRFSEFAALRKALWKIAQRDHGIVRCRYCEEFFNYVLFSKTQPNTMAKLTTSKEKRMRMLEAFINDVIAMARSCKTSQTCRTCSGEEAIPHLVNDFFQITPESLTQFSKKTEPEEIHQSLR